MHATCLISAALVISACGMPSSVTITDPNDESVLIGGALAAPVATYGGDSVARTSSLARARVEFAVASSTDDQQARSRLNREAASDYATAGPYLWIHHPAIAARSESTVRAATADRAGRPQSAAAKRAIGQAITYSSRPETSSDTSYDAAVLVELARSTPLLVTVHTSSATEATLPRDMVNVVLSQHASELQSWIPDTPDPELRSRIKDKIEALIDTARSTTARHEDSDSAELEQIVAEKIEAHVEDIEEMLTTAMRLDFEPPEVSSTDAKRATRLKQRMTALRRTCHDGQMVKLAGAAETIYLRHLESISGRLYDVEGDGVQLRLVESALAAVATSTAPGMRDETPTRWPLLSDEWQDEEQGAVGECPAQLWSHLRRAERRVSELTAAVRAERDAVEEDGG